MKEEIVEMILSKKYFNLTKKISQQQKKRRANSSNLKIIILNKYNRVRNGKI